MVFIFEWIDHFNGLIAEQIATFFPESGFLAGFAANSFTYLLVFFIVIGAIALFFDFIKDAWKMPFAILGDLIDILAIQYPGVGDIIAAIYSPIMFFILAHDLEHMKKLFGAIGFIEGIIGINFPFQAVGNLGYTTNLIPTNTILMFVATIID